MCRDAHIHGVSPSARGSVADNLLFYGDNLDVLRRHIADNAVDLVYLDPPFKSDQNYNVLFAAKDGHQAAAQIQVFEDTWHWDEGAARQYEETVELGGKVSEVLQAFRLFLGTNDMLAYLTMMAPRLVELHRVLNATGSLYLHCDPTASHYLKLLLDAIFGPQAFRNEIPWKRSSAHSDTRQGSRHYGRVSDSILFYARGDSNTWNEQYTPYDSDYLAENYKRRDSDGRLYRISDLSGPGGEAKGNPRYEFLGVTRYWRYSKERMQALYEQGRIIQTRAGAVPQYKRYLDEMPGVPIQNMWVDIPVINNRSKEALGYPTQKPVALLERIISTSSNKGDVVLDPFCGCGTTIDAAQKLGRRWIGIDVTHLAISLIKARLYHTYGDEASYEVIGEPTTAEDAAALAESDPYQFQWWALGLVGARPAEQRKGADKGIDGRLYFHDEAEGGSTKQVIFSVKAGHTSANHVRDLRGVVEREKAAIGVLLTMEEPTKPMRTEAASAGFYQSPGWHTKHPRLQILTVAELLTGQRVDMPPVRQVNVTFKRAPKAGEPEPEILHLDFSAPPARKVAEPEQQRYRADGEQKPKGRRRK